MIRHRTTEETMSINSDLRPIVKDVFVITRNNDRLRALITERSPGARDICDKQAEVLRALNAEIETVKRGGSWWSLNELIGQARTMDSLVLDMTDSIQHPELAKAARDWADENLP
jgi:hypothetical protein